MVNCNKMCASVVREAATCNLQKQKTGCSSSVLPNVFQLVIHFYSRQVFVGPTMRYYGETSTNKLWR